MEIDVVISKGGLFQFQVRCLGFAGKRVITTAGKFKYSLIKGWQVRMPGSAKFQPNAHMILPLCNKGSQSIF